MIQVLGNAVEGTKALDEQNWPTTSTKMDTVIGKVKIDPDGRSAKHRDGHDAIPEHQGERHGAVPSAGKQVVVWPDQLSPATSSAVSQRGVTAGSRSMFWLDLPPEHAGGARDACSAAAAAVASASR